ncbi:RNA pseudouridine synthase 6, chloroplastic-like [Spinacia oleracea]|uniref:RNA pseudouridine synthase 6, chloroplastic-like n=1 Tax=Spinacia oleracea TaxID=3562 RepID=A0ABM3QWV6_SPIOL|nr:RNA pseudouridine synthase 6, chloroplastic-like [Spinacia oleracea]
MKKEERKKIGGARMKNEDEEQREKGREFGVLFCLQIGLGDKKGGKEGKLAVCCIASAPSANGCYEIDWKSRIIAVTKSYVILDKPAGTSVGGTSNNIEETCANFTTRALGLTSPLLTTHQIDNCTEGCVVMARAEDYCSIFHEKIRDKKVKKYYLALVAAPVSCGIITHYMQPAKLAPRIVSEEYVKGSQLWQLEVLDCKEVPWPNTIIEEKYQINDCGWPVRVNIGPLPLSLAIRQLMGKNETEWIRAMKVIAVHFLENRKEYYDS